MAIKVALLVLTAALCFTAFAEGSTAWPLEWEMLGADLIGLAFMAFFLPRMVDKPAYKGSMFEAELFPTKFTWPVWLFWLGVAALVFHVACAIRGFAAGEGLDYHTLRSALLGGWLGLLHQGKLKGWTSAEPQEEKPLQISQE